MLQPLQIAIEHHRSGRLGEAENIYHQILAVEPDNAQVIHLLGLLACHRNDLSRGIKLIRRAAELMPSNSEFLIHLAEACRRANHPADAAAALRRAAGLAPYSPATAAIWYELGVVLRDTDPRQAMDALGRAISLRPDFAAAHNNLAVLQQQTGDFAASVESFRRAATFRPGHVETEVNLGMALWSACRETEALEVFQRAIRTRPDFPPAFLGLGATLLKLGQPAQAIPVLRQALTLDNNSPGILRSLARALLETGAINEAVDMARRGTLLAPDDPDAFHELGVTLAAKSASDTSAAADAIVAYHRALQLNPAMQQWSFELASLSGHTPSSAPDSFVRSLFDDYAVRFEHHLVNVLHYRIPAVLLNDILQLSSAPEQPWTIMDLGCGSGLCGECFRPHARHMAGIDLSPHMIELSRRRGGGKTYDELFCGNLVEGLRPHEGRFDIILAADVFVYVGSLEEILAAAARSLRPRGLLAFSLEKYDGDGFVLHPQRRFAHSLNYVRSQATALQLEPVVSREVFLRDDVGTGWMVVLQK